MSIKKRAVRVHQMPTVVTESNKSNLLNVLQMYAENERPRFVLDCSRLWDVDSSAIGLLLDCLEEVMKYNGDLRLASLCPKAEEALRQAGVTRLFEVYSTTDSAVQSFHQRAASIAPYAYDVERAA